MPESEIHIISALEKLDARPEDSAYSIRTQDNDIKRRINTLFNEKAGADQISEDEVDLKEDYETVNEGLTSDTTEGPAQGVKRTELSDAADISTSSRVEKEAEPQEGILSSDEEESAAQAELHLTEKVTKLNKVMSDKPLSQSGQPDIRSFDQTDKNLFDSQKSKEEVENKFSFAEQDVEFFSAKMQSRSDRELLRPESPLDEDGERNFVTQTDYSEEALNQLDVSALNLFGLPLEDNFGKDALKDIAGSNQET